MRVLMFGTYDTSMHPRVAIIGEGLKSCGFEVTECNVPLGLDTAARVKMLKRPWLALGLLVLLARRWTALALRARRIPAPDAVLVGYLGHFDVHLARLVFRKTPIILDHLVGASATARDRRLDGGLRESIVRVIDSAALSAATTVVVDTDEHLAALPEQHRPKAVVVPLGAPAAWYAASPADDEHDATAPLRVVFYGLYTPLQGTPTIGEALGKIANAAIDVTMIGGGQDKEETQKLAAANQRVRWLDWVPAAELPTVVASHDVCLGIFGTGEKALRVVPNKVFQGAAAGCALVTSDTAPHRRALGDAAILVPPGDPAKLAEALMRLADDRRELTEFRHRARSVALQEFTPERIVTPLIRHILPGTDAGTIARA